MKRVLFIISLFLLFATIQAQTIGRGQPVKAPASSVSFNCGVAVNCQFNSALTPWSGTGWAWQTDGTGGGWARHTAGNSTVMRQDGILTVGITYRIAFTIGGRTAGGVIPMAGSGTSGSYRTVNGTYTEDLLCATNGNLMMDVDSDFNGYIDDFSCIAL